MSYCKQFKTFDPLYGDVPDSPFNYLPSIANRARELLQGRTSDQIESAAIDIDWAISEYFKTVKEEEIARLRRKLDEPCSWETAAADIESAYDNAQMFFVWDGDSQANGGWVFNESMEELLLIPTPEIMTEVDALKECVGWFNGIGGEGFHDAKDYEFFAVLGLWMVADALNWIRRRRRNQSDTGLFSLAGGCAIKAMDAVCYAEHLHDRVRMDSVVSEKIAALQDQLKAYETIQASLVASQETRLREEKQKRSLIAERLNIERHKTRNEARAKAIEEWEKEPSRFRSAEKAGNYLADWLEQFGYTYEPRTVTTWIREYAKEIGVKFR